MENQPPTNLYPTLSVTHIQNPNKLWAIPIFGFLVKIIILIPVLILMLILYLAYFFVAFGNSLVVLFTGKYWDTAYTFSLGVMRLTTKVTLYIYGLTDKYPGFDLIIQDSLIALDMKMPENPNRLFAIPLLGGMARIILLIPYFIYQGVLGNAAWIGAAISSFWVLFAGRYPETSYELARDQMRVTQASTAYLLGLSDRYPSFWISMNHQQIKIILIIIGVLLFIANMFSSD